MKKVRTQAGKYLAKLRVELDEQQQDMADRLGISNSTLSNIEYGKREIERGLAQHIALTYNMTHEQQAEFYFWVIKGE